MSYSIRIFNYVDEIPNIVWDKLSIAENIYFTKPYLKAFEVHNSQKTQFFYLIVFNKTEPVSIAIIQVLEFDFLDAV